ncbi:hypothetical protein CP061683_2194 [Chlamydia psittaci 06-1683]|nr:hypothetical protein CP061683_2194 [Chlamydia psittaci 06-1683]
MLSVLLALLRACRASGPRHHGLLSGFLTLVTPECGLLDCQLCRRSPAMTATVLSALLRACRMPETLQ